MKTPAQMSKHTPTPWKILPAYQDGWWRCHIQNERYVVAIAIGSTKEGAENDAAHMVKCVNLHDDLIEALQSIADLPGGTAGTALTQAKDTARAVLAKAKGDA